MCECVPVLCCLNISSSSFFFFFSTARANNRTEMCATECQNKSHPSAMKCMFGSFFSALSRFFFYFSMSKSSSISLFFFPPIVRFTLIQNSKHAFSSNNILLLHTWKMVRSYYSAFKSQHVQSCQLTIPLRLRLCDEIHFARNRWRWYLIFFTRAPRTN